MQKDIIYFLSTSLIAITSLFGMDLEDNENLKESLPKLSTFKSEDLRKEIPRTITTTHSTTSNSYSSNSQGISESSNTTSSYQSHCSSCQKELANNAYTHILSYLRNIYPFFDFNKKNTDEISSLAKNLLEKKGYFLTNILWGIYNSDMDSNKFMIVDIFFTKITLT